MATLDGEVDGGRVGGPGVGRAADVDAGVGGRRARHLEAQAAAAVAAAAAAAAWRWRRRRRRRLQQATLFGPLHHQRPVARHLVAA